MGISSSPSAHGSALGAQLRKSKGALRAAPSPQSPVLVEFVRDRPMSPCVLPVARHAAVRRSAPIDIPGGATRTRGAQIHEPPARTFDAWLDTIAEDDA